MDLEWEDQFGDLGLTMKPSEYWRRQCYATYQSDRIGIKMIDELGEDNVMWGSDFPHPDGVWPDSTEVIEKELGHLPADAAQDRLRERRAPLRPHPRRALITAHLRRCGALGIVQHPVCLHRLRL